MYVSINALKCTYCTVLLRSASPTYILYRFNFCFKNAIGNEEELMFVLLLTQTLNSINSKDNLMFVLTPFVLHHYMYIA